MQYTAAQEELSDYELFDHAFMEIHKRNAWISQAPLWLDRPLILSIAISTESTDDRSIYLAAIKVVNELLVQVHHSQAEFNRERIFRPALGLGIVLE